MKPLSCTSYRHPAVSRPMNTRASQDADQLVALNATCIGHSKHRHLIGRLLLR